MFWFLPFAYAISGLHCRQIYHHIRISPPWSYRHCLLLANQLSHSLSSMDPLTVVGVDFLHHCRILLPSLPAKVQNSKQNTFSNFFYSSSYEYIHVLFILICVQTTKYNGFVLVVFYVIIMTYLHLFH